MSWSCYVFLCFRYSISFGGSITSQAQLDNHLGLERIGVDWASSSCINFGSQYSLASLYPNFCVQKFGPVSPKLCWTEELRGTLQTSKTSRILYKIVLQRWLPFSRSGPGPSQAHFLSIQSHSIQSCSNNKRPVPGSNTKFGLSPPSNQ